QQGNVISGGEQLEGEVIGYEKEGWLERDGYFVYTYTSDTLPIHAAHWCWVNAQATDNSNIKRWIHTSYWCKEENGQPVWPYYSNMGRFAAWDERIFIPREHAYYMYAFRWLPADEEHAYYVALPVDEPWEPDWAQGMQSSPVYITHRYEYGGQYTVKMLLTFGIAW
ncbi:MAG: hypothetical protein ABIN23_08710, partial [candidate division WOR-3 bacterium]